MAASPHAPGPNHRLSDGDQRRPGDGGQLKIVKPGTHRDEARRSRIRGGRSIFHRLL
jgi:hypothetical protein